jgi:methionine-S-sulfoxide reductase
MAPLPSKWTERLDSILLHKWLGPAAFALVVTLVFQAIFTWAVPLMDLVDLAVSGSGAWLSAQMGDTWYRSLLIDGIWQGVGSVLVFLPQILVLFLFLGILEDSGYMARAAVIADRLMQRVGLQGRAFLPLLSAYACAVPAILSARTVEDERDRLATIFVAPFMTCSARLPVYALLIAAFVPERPVLGPVLGVRSGYAGGTADTANYRAVCSGATDHAEAVEIRFDPGRLTFGEILKVFFAVAHDPTELNRQGNDIGRQYRSAIFYADQEQQAVADAYVKQLNAARVFGSPIVTRLEPLQTFYEAEGYHQEYAAHNPEQPYVACVALPKMRKLRTYFPDRLKRG